MAVVTICSDFGAQKIKSDTVSTVSPSISHEVMFSYTSLYIMLWRRKWQPTPVFLPGKSHGQRSLVGYSPRGRKELDITERHHFLSLMIYVWPGIGEIHFHSIKTNKY